MKKLTLRQILILHEYQVKKHGGSQGVRDMGMLESAVNRPFATFGGGDLYPDIYFKAAALMQSIIKNHPFVDGNKRTGFTSSYTLLLLNKIKITAKQEEMIKFTLKIANENVSVDEIVSWLQKYSKKLI